MKKSQIFLMLILALLTFISFNYDCKAINVKVDIYVEKTDEKGGLGTYTKSDTVPDKKDYKINNELTLCENASDLEIDEDTYEYRITAKEDDVCLIYFDYKTKAQAPAEEQKPNGGSNSENGSSSNNSSSGNGENNSTGNSSETEENSSNGASSSGTNNNGTTNSGNGTNANNSENVENPKTGTVIPITVGILLLVGVIVFVISKKHTKMFKVD